MSHIEVDVSVESELWQKIKDIESKTQTIVSKICGDLLPDAQYVEVSILLTDNNHIQLLNREYRSKDKPTNVLSFPQTEPQNFSQNAEFILLGDIIVAFETIKAESVEQNKTTPDHYTHMLVHGLLHLMHYDHITDEEAQIMENLEIQILHDLGIKNPYEISSPYAIVKE